MEAGSKIDPSFRVRLQERAKQGFTLVEMIAAMAIMMVLAGVTGPVREVFKICNMDSVFTVRTTRADSLILFPRSAS